MIHSNNNEKFFFEINKEERFNLFYFELKDEEGNIYSLEFNLFLDTSPANNH